MRQNNWTREELIVALNVYCKIPFQSSRKTHPMIVEVAALLGRSPSALNLKVGNFGRLDPVLAERGITGLTHGSRLEEIVWNEFYGQYDTLAFESEKILAEMSGHKLVEDAIMDNLPDGADKLALVKARVNQAFFRTMILCSYNNTCCISGIQNPTLLEASHILDWSDNIENRTNPHNGLCLNSMMHRAYDNNLIGISPDGVIKISDKMLSISAVTPQTHEWIKSFHNRDIIPPSKFVPDKDFLAIKYTQYLQAI